jgi:hypothetical protein
VRSLLKKSLDRSKDMCFTVLMMNYADLPEDVVGAIQELILSGETIDETDLDILRKLYPDPNTVGDILNQFSLGYEAMRRRCDKLEKFGLIAPVSRRRKSKVYLTGTKNYQSPVAMMRHPNNIIRYKRRDMTLQEFLVVLEHYSILEKYRQALKGGIYHLAYCEKHPELDLKPTGVQVRLMILNMAGQLGEMSRIFERISNMTIYDNSIGARNGLSSINETLLRETSADGITRLSDRWEVETGPEGMIFNIEVAKAFHAVLARVKEQYPDEETPDAD